MVINKESEEIKMEINQLSKRFKTFAKEECAGSSELYEYLSLKIAEDHELLKLSAYAKKEQPIPNLFLGAVHYLLLKGNDHKLKKYYPSIVDKPRRLQDSFPSFKHFCLTYKDQIIPILQNKRVQTNEVRRCGYLYPCFSYVYEKVKKPLALIEIGTSAGFQLLWDKYSYAYHSNEVYGATDSNVHITSKIKGKNTPFLPKVSPPVTHRYGLDLHINHLSKAEDALWLNALIWPEHKERRTLFKQALACMVNHQNKLHLIEGNGIELLPHFIEKIPIDSTICIFHTHVANQIPVDLKYKLLDTIKNTAKTRDIFHIYNNIWDKDLHIDSYMNGVEYKQTIAETDGHGRWFKWLL